jgi:hypothetical protein
LAPVFLGAEDHPPRDRRPKCLTGSAITLVRSARPNPRGRHARVADPSGVECQRDGSDQGQRMEAGDGALTPDRRPAPSRDANRSPAVPPSWSQLIVMFQTGVSRIRMLPMNTRRATRPTRPLAPGRNAPNLAPSVSFRLWISRRARDRRPHGGRLPGRLRWRDQSPAPALPGCAIVFPAEVLQSINAKPTLKSPHLIVRKT